MKKPTKGIRRDDAKPRAPRAGRDGSAPASNDRKRTSKKDFDPKRKFGSAPDKNETKKVYSSDRGKEHFSSERKERGSRPYEDKPYSSRSSRDGGEKRPYNRKPAGDSERPKRSSAGSRDSYQNTNRERNDDRRNTDDRRSADRPYTERGSRPTERKPYTTERKPRNTGDSTAESRGTGRERSSDDRRSSSDKPYTERKSRSTERPYSTERRPRSSEDSYTGRSERDKKDSIPFERKKYVKKEYTPSDKPAKKADPATDGLMRLNRYISNSGICSRRKADDLITSGQISVNGVVITELGYKINPEDVVKFNAKKLKREKLVYVLLNKPRDFITTTDDPQDRRTVMELVKNATDDRIYPVGRLDRNTTGLLLLTNDGDLAQKLSHPSNNVRKIYEVTLDRSLAQKDFEQIKAGVELEDGIANVDDLAFVDGKSKSVVGIEIHIGRNRIVRRIFESLGYTVEKLDRVIYAGLTKKDLGRGRWRHLNKEELVMLKHLMKY